MKTMAALICFAAPPPSEERDVSAFRCNAWSGAALPDASSLVGDHHNGL
jgi:hypothetical protein